MSRLLLLDFETSGLDVKQDRITQWAVDLWDTDTNESLVKTGFLFDATYPTITEEITRLTKITKEILETQGEHPGTVLERLAQTAMQCEFIVAYSGLGFDKPILENECKRHGVALPKVNWIDPKFDLPFPQRLKCRTLTHVAFEHGYYDEVDADGRAINKRGNAHGAPEDVRIMKYVMQKYDLKPVMELCAQPRYLIKAQSQYNDREKVKSNGYSWESIGDIRVNRTWIKIIRESQWDKENDEMFKINVPITKTLLE